MDEEIYEWLDKYRDAFGDGFPTYQVMRGRTDEEGIAIIKQCLEEKKDVYELGIVTLDEDVDY